MLGIPECVKLEDRQIKRLERWIETLDKKELDAASEEDCSCACPLTWTIYASGIDDVIIVKALGQKLDLSIDDDNNLVNP